MQVKIIQSQTNAGEVKTEAEAEWAFFTEMYNFIIDDHLLN